MGRYQNFGLSHAHQNACNRLRFSWLLYDGYNYNSDPADRLRNMYLGWGESFCESFGSDFSAIASSARYVGPPDGYK